MLNMLQPLTGCMDNQWRAICKIQWPWGQDGAGLLKLKGKNKYAIYLGWLDTKPVYIITTGVSPIAKAAVSCCYRVPTNMSVPQKYMGVSTRLTACEWALFTEDLQDQVPVHDYIPWHARSCICEFPNHNEARAKLRKHQAQPQRFLQPPCRDDVFLPWLWRCT